MRAGEVPLGNMEHAVIKRRREMEQLAKQESSDFSQLTKYRGEMKTLKRDKEKLMSRVLVPLDGISGYEKSARARSHIDITKDLKAELEKYANVNAVKVKKYMRECK